MGFHVSGLEVCVLWVDKPLNLLKGTFGGEFQVLSSVDCRLLTIDCRPSTVDLPPTTDHRLITDILITVQCFVFCVLWVDNPLKGTFRGGF